MAPLRTTESSERFKIAAIDSGTPPKRASLFVSFVIEPLRLEAKLANSIGMEMVLIDSGEFVMGDADAILDFPPHHVTITKPFYLGSHEVTVGQFRQFVKAAEYQTEVERETPHGESLEGEGVRVRDEVTLVRAEQFDWQNAGSSSMTAEDFPVVNVTWNDADAFCKWLTQTEGILYRLPTEAEWEYACRAGSKTAFCYGDAVEKLAEYANVFDLDTRGRLYRNYADCVKIRDGSSLLAKTGTYRPNAFGVYDMHGNVREWCSDWWGEYPEEPVTDPLEDIVGPSKVLRGGGWKNSRITLAKYSRSYSGSLMAWRAFYSAFPYRSACRMGAPPKTVSLDIGFRVVRTIKKD